MLTQTIARHLLIALAGAAIAGLAASPALAARRFSGFDTSFAMGRSAASGAVCKADRDFDDPLISDHTRAWTVTCRGWTIPLGRVYLFEGSHAQPPETWRAELASRAACADQAAAPDLPGAMVAECKTTPGNLPYLVLSLNTGHGVVLAEGMGPLGDVLTTAVKFVAGKIDEPAPVSEQLASVATAAKGGGLAAVDAGAKPSLDSRREQAYRLDQAWEFDKAEQIFADLASTQNTPSGRIEALYNSALAVSNEGRFDEADFYFKQADEQAAQIGADASLRALALNYRAAHARNQRDYQGAVDLAEQAIAERRAATAGTAAVIADANSIRIADGGFSSGFSATRLTPEERNALRDVQAMQIEATSLEALGREDQARDVLQKAVASLDEPMLVAGTTKPPTLGFASFRLNTQVRMDVLRLDRNIGRAADATPQAEAAIATYRKKYPGTLPLAGFLVELARAEAAAGQDDRALSDYEDAFSIFRNQRGALGASTDLIGTYFDILLKRIGDAPAQHQSEVGRFFAAAQTLAAPSSAEAAKRQTARVMGSDTAAAGLARGLDDVERSIELKQQEVRDLREQGLYQGAAKTRADSELAALAVEDKALQGQLATTDLRYESELRRFIGLDELQKTLRPGEAYVKVFMLANRGYGMLVTADSARPYSIELARTEAQAMVDGLRKPIDRLNQMEHPTLGRYDVALAHDAFERLFGPVKSDLLSAKIVIYEPDITLIGIPIAALVTDDASVAAMKVNLDRAVAAKTPLTYANVSWFGAHVASALALSPSAFVQARLATASKAPRAFYGFGDPQITDNPREFRRVETASSGVGGATNYCEQVRRGLLNLEPLPQTADEIKVVASSLGQDASSYSLGNDFTDSRVVAMGLSGGGLAQYRVLYFATHGVLLPPKIIGCLQPALVTSLGAPPSDGLIDVRDIPKLNIDADIVVLSACDTGRSQGNGDDAIGMVTTFVEAGARNVVVSNWPADSTATERLMTQMFTHRGESQADALVQAARTLMASPDQYSHPFYWAAFTVVGDGARPMPGS